MSKSNYDNRGDTLEVKIRDGIGNYYFKSKALINSKRQLKELLDTLEEKGVPIRRVLQKGLFD